MEFWGYEANEFVEIELRKSSSKSILPKNMFALHFLSSMPRNKADSKPHNFLIVPPNLHEFPLAMIVGWIYAKSCQNYA